MYIEKCLENKTEFKILLNNLLSSQSKNLRITGAEISEINRQCWCKVEYINSNTSEKYSLLLNDFKVYSNDNSLDIIQLNKNYVKAIYLSNLKDAASYIYEYKKQQNLPNPKWLSNYQTAQQTGFKNNPEIFYGITPEDLKNKILYAKYLSPSSNISDEEKVEYIFQHKQLLEKSLIDLANLYELEYKKEDIKNTIDKTLLQSRQNILKKQIKNFLKQENGETLLRDVKEILLLEKNIDSLTQQKKQLEKIFAETNGFSIFNLTQQIQNYCLNNCELMQDEFYRNIIENTIVLESLKTKVGRLKTDKDIQTYWKNTQDDLNKNLTQSLKCEHYSFPFYIYASMIFNSLKNKSEQQSDIQQIYKEFLLEQGKVFNSEVKTLSDITLSIQVNYCILAQAIKKLNNKNCLKIELISDALIKHHNSTMEEVQKQFELDKQNLNLKLKSLNSLYRKKIRNCSDDCVQLKSVLTHKNTLDKKLNKLQQWQNEKTLDALVSFDNKKINLKEVEKQLITKPKYPNS